MSVSFERLQLGLGVTAAPDVAAAARRAEALGFDYVSCGEHLFFHGPVPNAFVSLAAAAAVTTRVKLLTSITILPLYPAALVAKLASTLDVVSGGRFHLGVGVGGEFPAEFAAAGVPVRERGARADEALEVIAALFAQERASFTGRWARLEDVGLQPRPVQDGGPPIWVAGRGDVAIRRAARWGQVWMPHLCTPEHLAEGMGEVREQAVAHGRAADAVTGSVFAFITTDPDGDRARQMATDWVGHNYRQDFSRLGHLLIAGTPEECVARLREYHAAGASSVQLTLAAPPEEADAMLDRVGGEVLGALRRP